MGCNVVGVSDIGGALYSASGIDVVRLVEYKQEAGTVVGFPGAEELTNEELRELLYIDTVRSEMLSQICRAPYGRPCLGYPRAKYDRAYSDALTWAYKMVEKNDIIIE